MKTSLSIALVATGCCLGNPALAGPITITERGPNHRVIQELLPDGSTSEYVELRSGMNFADPAQPGVWKESSSLIEVINGAAVARQGQAKIIWAANLNSAGAIDILSSQNRRFRVTPIGLAYTSKSGQSVMIAGLRDSEGFVHENSVYYFDAFDGGFVATVQIIHKIASIEQNVILEEAVPPPRDYAGFENEDPADIFLEVWSEFFEAPAPIIRETVIKREENEQKRGTLAEPDIIDKRLDFGEGDVLIAGGRAFDLGTTDPLGPGTVATMKDWIRSPEGRVFLVERVPFLTAEPHIRALPPPGAKVNVPKRGVPAQGERLMARAFPPSPKGERGSWKANQQAALKIPDKGYVLDWTMLTGAITNYLFTNTLYISGECQLYGTSTFSSAVIKFAPTNSASLHLLGPAVFECDRFRPLICTGRDDHTVGEPVGSATLTNFYGTRMLYFDYFTPYDIKHVHIAHADTGIAFDYDTGHGHNLSHVQFEDCAYGLVEFNTTLRLRNILMHNVHTNFYTHTYPSTNHCEHLTIDDSDRLNVHTSTNRLYMTNCLLVAIDNFDKGYDTNQSSNVSVVSDGSTVFTTAGAGGHFLKASYRNTGTANISPTMAAELRELTTYPPQVLLNTEINMDTVWGRTAPRDVDIPDVGAHYPPLDYLVDTVRITNATLRIGEGVAVGSFGGIGFWLQDYSTLLCQGSPTRPNTLVRYYAVQEATTNRGTVAQAMLYGLNNSNSPPVVRLRFTESYIAPGGGYHIYALNSSGWRFNQVEIRDCSLYGGTIYLSDRAAANYGFTNNLMRRMTLTASGAQTLAFCNNLWKDDAGTTLLPSSANIFFFYDDLLDTGTLKNLSANLVHHYNAYYQSSNFYSSHPTNPATEQVLSSLTYQSLGPWDFFQPNGSLLVDAGSTNAHLRGMFHYCALTNQVAEGTNRLDVGVHRVAFTNGVPNDFDVDGIPDVLEDIDGDGDYDSGTETDWKTYNSMNRLTSSPGLTVFTPLYP